METVIVILIIVQILVDIWCIAGVVSLTHAVDVTLDMVHELFRRNGGIDSKHGTEDRY